jgi:hypothetical protein
LRVLKCRGGLARSAPIAFAVGHEVAMRWVCILFPQLALDAVLRQRADPSALAC